MPWNTDGGGALVVLVEAVEALSRMNDRPEGSGSADNQRCETCRFWVIAGGRTGCHRSPEVMFLRRLLRLASIQAPLLGGKRVDKGYVDDPTEWCGQWEARES